jgi:hypothetical protein
MGVSILASFYRMSTITRGVTIRVEKSQLSVLTHGEVGTRVRAFALEDVAGVRSVGGSLHIAQRGGRVAEVRFPTGIDPSAIDGLEVGIRDSIERATSSPG